MSCGQKVLFGIWGEGLFSVDKTTVRYFGGTTACDLGDMYFQAVQCNWTYYKQNAFNIRMLLDSNVKWDTLLQYNKDK